MAQEDPELQRKLELQELRDGGAESGGEPDDPDSGSTPFDSPWFIPVLLWGFTLWFGYDAWIVPMEEWLAFNRYGFFVVLALSIFFTYRALKESRQGSGGE